MRFDESAADKSVICIIGFAFSRQALLDRDDRATLDTDIDAFCLRAAQNQSVSDDQIHRLHPYGKLERIVRNLSIGRATTSVERKIGSRNYSPPANQFNVDQTTECIGRACSSVDANRLKAAPSNRRTVQYLHDCAIQTSDDFGRR